MANPFYIINKYGLKNPFNTGASSTGDPATDQLNSQISNYQQRLQSSGVTPPELKKKPNLLLQTLALLDRPRAALWSGLHDQIAGTNSGDFAQGAVAGLTGKENYTGAELLKDMGSDNKIVNGVGGFLAEAVGDPLNLVTLGAGSLGKGLITGAAKSLGKTEAEALAKMALKDLSVQGAENSVKKMLGKDLAKSFTKEDIERLTSQSLYHNTNNVLGKVGTELGTDALTKKPNELLKTAINKYGTATLENDAKTAGKGLSIAGKNIGGLTNNALQDIGAKASNYVANNVPVLGNVVSSVQKLGNSIFNTANITGLGAVSQGMVKGVKDLATGEMNLANKTAREQAMSWAKDLSPEEDAQVRKVLEGSVKPEEVSDTTRRVAEEMGNQFKDMGKKEALKTMMKNYFPHKMSFEYATDSGKAQRLGGLTEHFKLDQPSSYMRKYRGTVEQANQIMKLNTSTPVERELFFNEIEKVADPDLLKAYNKERTADNLGALLDNVPEDKLNDAMYQLGGVDNYFETSAVKAYMLRALESNKVLADKGFLDNITSGFGERVHKNSDIYTMRNKGMDIVVPKSSFQMFKLDTNGSVVINSALKNLKKEASVANKAAKGASLEGEVVDRVNAADMLNEEGVSKIKGKVHDVLRRILDDTSKGSLTTITPEELAIMEKSSIFGSYNPIEAYAMPKGIIDYVNNATGKQINEGMGGLKGALTAFYKIWKPSVTGLNPDYYIRNVGGNTFNTMLNYGIQGLNPITQKDGLHIASLLTNKSAEAGDKVLIDDFGVSVTAKELADNMMRHNAASTFAGDAGEISSALNNQLSNAVGGAGANLKNQMFGKVIGANNVEKTADVASKAVAPLKMATGKLQQAGNKIELQGKATNYLIGVREGLEKGMTKEQAFKYAADNANKYLFNYSDLSEVEKNYLRNIFPFYTWARKNIPLQLETLFNDPKIMTVLPKYERNVNEANGVDTTHMPDYFKGSLPIPIPGMGAGADGRVPMANMSLPEADIGNLTPDGIGKYILGMLNPVAKTAIENTMNQSTLTGAPIYKNDHEKFAKQLGNFVKMFGTARNISNIASPQATDNKPVSQLAPQIPMVGNSVAKAYNPAEGAKADMYEYNRQLGNEVQYQKSTRGADAIPDMANVDAYNMLSPKMRDIVNKYGLNPMMLPKKTTNETKAEKFAKVINTLKNGGL